ncbi:MAG TPA: hypothetical protein VF815_24705 [Myxococcaceae bacterium]|jgi:hypothetical protein
MAAWRWLLGASLLACGLAVAQPLPQSLGKPDRIAVDRRSNKVLELSWSDAEERLKGSLQPDVPRAGEPLKVLLHVGSFEGAEFQGPLTVTLRQAGMVQGETKLVTRGPVNWVTEFTPQEDGPHTLSVSFRTTRHKVLNADFEVAPSLVPRTIIWSLVGLMAVAALAFGIRSLTRPEKAPEVHPVLAELRAAESAPAPTPAQVSPPASTPPASAAEGSAGGSGTESSTGSAPDKPSAL